MVKIFIVGANGVIGNPVAQALCRAGFCVYGLTRSMNVARKLQENESTAYPVTPVIGDATNPREWINKVKEVDIVIDVVGGDNKAGISTSLYNSFSQEARRFRQNGPPLIYIYTSEVWVLGENKLSNHSDHSPAAAGIQLNAWRISHEKLITSTKTNFIQGIVIRPGLVYGRNGSLVVTHLFKRASSGFVQWYGKRGGRVATIHVDDLADLYVKVVEKSPIIGGLTFLGANPESESWDFVLAELCKLVGARDVAYLPASAPVELALALSQKINPSLASSLLSWVPKKRSLADGMAEYYAAWEASEGKITVLNH